ncbi:protein-methionine-sulfoxide reductase heme-binding subunit MsrQ [Azotobacter beijerinckii]|uniref:protein-methionine-sulfoxide reductase heme-binding subunit MsrQ n=1 Tax=Azotobacter beijerinckii TaxID=170623 RepID=UPI00295574A6|nr:protein-methionine-sulfoxide reductase heme-binding subunit MsrQ [Azotobacter beijerinckii]MDV7213021.1 protein-methionine-sulfoxide reductase heme-binding subunit MsrQ [Azotobacter beijerinckii]
MKHPFWRCGVFVAALLPPPYWLYQAWTFALGPDPGKVLLERLGQGSLVLLLLTLCLTPLQRATHWSGWALVRRQLGLWCFAYACLHLSVYLLVVLGLDFTLLGDELRKRPYILVGALAWCSLLPLALTSNRFSMRRLGRRWKQLHRLAYAALGLGLLHMLWIVRSDLGQWTLYGVWALLLLALRLPGVGRRLGRRAGSVP